MLSRFKVRSCEEGGDINLEKAEGIGDITGKMGSLALACWIEGA